MTNQLKIKKNKYRYPAHRAAFGGEYIPAVEDCAGWQIVESGGDVIAEGGEYRYSGEEKEGAHEKTRALAERIKKGLEKADYRCLIIHEPLTFDCSGIRAGKHFAFGGKEKDEALEELATALGGWLKWGDFIKL